MAKLEALNVFKNVTLQFDTAKDENDVELGGVQVDFIVEEYGRIASALSASAGTQTGDAVSVYSSDWAIGYFEYAVMYVRKATTPIRFSRAHVLWN